MMNKRIRAYWLVLLALLALLMAANMILSVEPSQAHYINTTVWTTVVEAEENAVTSNYLAKTSGAPYTVLIGDITMEEYQVMLELKSTRDMTGSLTWKVKENQAAYLNVAMFVDALNEETGETIKMVVEPGTDIALKANETTEVMVCLIPTSEARAAAEKPRTIDVELNWENTLTSTFRVTLPVVEEPEPEETQPEETKPEETKPEETKPEETKPEEAQPEETKPEETEPVQTEPAQPVQETEPVSDVPENSTDTTVYSNDPERIAAHAQTSMARSLHNHILLSTEQEDASAAQEDVQAAATIVEQAQVKKLLAIQENMTHPDAPVALEVANALTITENDPTDPAEPEPTEPEPVLEPTEPDPTEPQPISEPTDPDPTTTDPTEPVSGEETPQFRLETIPNFLPGRNLPVKLTWKEGIDKVALGLGTVSDADITIEKFPAKTCYSLDGGASYYMLYQEGLITLDPKDYTSPVLLDLSRLELAADAAVTLAAAGYVNEVLDSTVIATTTPSAAALYQADSQFVTRKTPLKITLDSSWKEYSFAYNVQLLTEEKTENGSFVPRYEDVDASLWSTFTTDEENTMLQFQLNEVLPPAGTYRVQMKWSHEGVCFMQDQVTFFVNYAVDTESEGTGGAEQ